MDLRKYTLREKYTKRKLLIIYRIKYVHKILHGSQKNVSSAYIKTKLKLTEDKILLFIDSNFWYEAYGCVHHDRIVNQPTES